MQTIQLETKIAAPIERCFLLSTSIDLHLATTAHTREQAIAGVTHGLIHLGEAVTWRGRHFGLMLTHTSRITAYSPPHHFRDEMVRGCFRTFAHDHHFVAQDGATLMTDELRFESPLQLFGLLIDKLILKRHLEAFLQQRNQILKQIAESDAWKKYLSLE